MKVLVVGGGGREHAIVTALAKSEKVDKIYCVPGNAGIAKLAECEAIGVMEFDKIAMFALEKQVDLVVVGPDDPLVAGLVDVLETAGLKAFGPDKKAEVECLVWHRCSMNSRKQVPMQGTEPCP